MLLVNVYFFGFALGGMFCFLYGIVDKDGFGILGIILGSILFCVFFILELVMVGIIYGKKEIKTHLIIDVLVMLSLTMLYLTYYGIEHTLWLSIIFGALGLCCFTFLLSFYKKFLKKKDVGERERRKQLRRPVPQRRTNPQRRPVPWKMLIPQKRLIPWKKPNQWKRLIPWKRSKP